MPIKPENKKLYPKNWKEIRQQILERANNECEFCGVENHEIGYRNKDGIFIRTPSLSYQEAAKHLGYKVFKIVLTIAHLDHNPQNNNPENLRALCQKCHLNYDKEHHAESRKKTRKNKN